MNDFILHHWYLGLAFSVIYTIGASWWTVTAERRFRQLKAECRILDLALEAVRNDLMTVQLFLENGNTLRSIRLVTPLPPSAPLPASGAPVITTPDMLGKRGA